MRKYEFTGKSTVIAGVTVQSIRRISDRVLGGWIESDKLHASGWDFKAHLDLVRALGAH